MHDEVLFDKMGLRLGTVRMCSKGAEFDTSGIKGYVVRQERDFNEVGLLISTTVFSLLALLFLVPIIEDLLKPKFFFVVVVGVFLALVSIQDYFTIKNPGESRLMLVTDYGARFGLQTASQTILAEAIAALESLGISHASAPESGNLRMKTTASGTSSAS